MYCVWCSVAKWRPTLCNPVEYSLPGSSVHEFSRQNTGVGCYFLLQGIFLTQGLNPHLLNWQADSELLLSHWGNPIYRHNHLMQSLIVIVVLWSWQMYSPSSLRVNLDTHLKVSTAFLPDILESCTLGAGHLSNGGSTA